MVSARSPRSVRATAAVTFGVAVVLIPSGCAGVGGSSASQGQPKIGYVISSTTAHFAQDMGAGFHAGAETAGGVEATVVGPPVPDGAKQVDLFKELATTTRGGIAVSATSRAAFVRPLAEASASGLPLVASAGQPPSGSGVKLLVENDNYELGRMLAEEAIKRLPPDAAGKVIVGNDVATHPALEKRSRGIRDRFASERPNMQVLGPFDTKRDPAANVESWRWLVATHPDALAFLGTGDHDTINIADIRAGSTGTWLAGGFGGDPHALQGVKDGRLFAVVSPEHFLKGACTGWLLAENAKGETPLPEGWLATPGLAITSDNVDEIAQRQSSEALRLAWIQPEIDRVMSNPSQFLRPLDQAE